MRKMNKEKVFIEGYEVGITVGTSGTIKKKIQVSSGDIVSIDENFIYKSIEPEKVKIPQFVADWIEESKQSCGNIVEFFCHKYTNIELVKYFSDKDKFDLVARAWLDGYEIEKEKRYSVTLKSSGQMLYYHTEDEDYIFSSYDGVFYSEYHTKIELEENGMSWVFDCEGVEVNEVE